MIGAYQPSAEFIKLARLVKLDATFVNISFVGADALAKEVGPAGAGVVVTEVVPLPRRPIGRHRRQVSGGAEGIEARCQAGLRVTRRLHRWSPDSLALEQSPGEITRQALLDTIGKTGRFDLGGMQLVYGPNNNRGSAQVFLVVIQPDGSLKPVAQLARSSS